MNSKSNITMLDDLPDLDDMEQNMYVTNSHYPKDNNIMNGMIPENMYNKYKGVLKNNHQVPPESGMAPIQYKGSYTPIPKTYQNQESFSTQSMHYIPTSLNQEHQVTGQQAPIYAQPVYVPTAPLTDNKDEKQGVVKDYSKFLIIFNIIIIVMLFIFIILLFYLIKTINALVKLILKQ